MPQLSYLKALPIAYPGLKGDGSMDVVETRVNADTDSIPFGVFVAAGGSIGDGGAVLPTGSTDKLFGPVVHSHTYARVWTDSDGNDHGELDAVGLTPKALLNVMVKGRIWVMSETTADVGDPVFVRYAAGVGGTQLGAVRNATVSSEMIDLTAKARYLTSVASAPGLALIEVDMTA
jgi:hypothetical protein